MSSPILRKTLPYKYYYAAFVLIGINVFVFLINRLVPRSLAYLAMNPVLVVQHHFYWQFVTYMFTHANIGHILFNMLGLFFFGVQIEKQIGSSEFLLYYLLTGILSGIFSFLVYLAGGRLNVIPPGGFRRHICRTAGLRYPLSPRADIRVRDSADQGTDSGPDLHGYRTCFPDSLRSEARLPT